MAPMTTDDNNMAEAAARDDERGAAADYWRLMRGRTTYVAVSQESIWQSGEDAPYLTKQTASAMVSAITEAVIPGVRDVYAYDGLRGWTVYLQPTPHVTLVYHHLASVDAVRKRVTQTQTVCGWEPTA